MFSRVKRSSLLNILVNYGAKSFISMARGLQQMNWNGNDICSLGMGVYIIKLFTVVIYRSVV
jgi:hypothetical protein